VKLSKRDFKLFKKEFKWWADAFGCQDWDVYIEHAAGEGDSEKNLADILWVIDDRAARVRVSLDWGKIKFDANYVQCQASHEARHLLFARLHSLAEDRSATEDEIAEEVHAISQKLEHFFKRVGLLRD